MNLNKKNFFNQEWLDMFPLASKHFCNWIDEYKRDADWDKLFSVHPWSKKFDRLAVDTDYKTHERGEIYPHRYKFHDIPFELQFGILCKYFSTFDVDLDYRSLCQVSLIVAFKTVERKIKGL